MASSTPQPTTRDGHKNWKRWLANIGNAVKLSNTVPAPTALDNPAPKPWQKWVTFTKRLVTLSSLAAAIYVLIGCWMFPYWWYVWFWQAEFKDQDYNLEGLQNLLDNYFWLVLIVIAAIFVTAILAKAFRRQLFRAVDALGGFIVFLVTLSLVTTFLFLYHNYHPTGRSAFDELAEADEQTAGQLNILDALDRIYIPTPIDFDYIDRERVDALYNQLEQELVEKERTISDNSTSQAKLGAAGGGISAEAQQGKNITSTSSFSRTHFSQERECIEVMKYVIDSHGARAYTTSETWMTYRQNSEIILEQQRKQITTILVRQREGLGLPPSPPSGKNSHPSTDEERKEQDRKLLMTELQNLQGLIFLDNAFDKITSTTGWTLVGKFSTKPRVVAFRVHIPKSAKADLPKNGRLRVFGDIVRPLGEDGYVDVRAIAIF